MKERTHQITATPKLLMEIGSRKHYVIKLIDMVCSVNAGKFEGEKKDSHKFHCVIDCTWLGFSLIKTNDGNKKQPLE